jgi:hypothetical protein
MNTTAAGLVPELLHDFCKHRPDVAVKLIEDKAVRPVAAAARGSAGPRLLSSAGRRGQKDLVPTTVQRDAGSPFRRDTRSRAAAVCSSRRPSTSR